MQKANWFEEIRLHTMIRKYILLLVSTLTILAGFYRIWSFISPILDPNKPKLLDPVALIVGTLLLLVGWGLFRRNEFALLFGFWIWLTSLIWDSIRIAIFLAQIGSTSIEHGALLVILLLLLLAAELYVVIFLGQKRTKVLFVSNVAESV